MKDFEDTDREGATMDSSKPLTVGEIEALKSISADYGKHGVEWKEAMFVLEALPRLLSLLTPPPDAAVREAVERLSAGVNGPWEGSGSMFADIRTHLRAVQAPRPSSEQHRVVRIAVINADLRGDTEESEALREAFPGAFAGEE